MQDDKYIQVSAVRLFIVLVVIACPVGNEHGTFVRRWDEHVRQVPDAQGPQLHNRSHVDGVL